MSLIEKAGECFHLEGCPLVSGLKGPRFLPVSAGDARCGLRYSSWQSLGLVAKKDAEGTFVENLQASCADFRCNTSPRSEPRGHLGQRLGVTGNGHDPARVTEVLHEQGSSGSLTKGEADRRHLGTILN